MNENRKLQRWWVSSEIPAQMALTVNQRMLDLVRGHQVAAMVHHANQLRIAEKLNDGVEISLLARQLDLDPDALRRLICALSSFGVFDIDNNGIVTNTAASDLLRPDAVDSIYAASMYWALPSNWAIWGAFGQSIRDGQSIFERVHGSKFFDYIKDHHDERDLFDKFMANSPDKRQEAVLEAIPLSGGETVIDVGGGDGSFLLSLYSKYPGISATLLESSDVIVSSHVKKYILDGSISVIFGDMMDDVPSGFDVVILSQILHDWPEDQCDLILRNCHRAMRGNGRILIVERMLDSNHRATTRHGYLSDVEMLLYLDGRERSDLEYRELLSRNGFILNKVIATSSPFVILEARPNT